MNNVIEDGDYKPQKERLKLVVNRLMSVNPLFYELLNLMQTYVSNSIAGIIPCDTACTYDKTIVVSPEFMDKLDDIELLVVLDHEINHYINGHTSFNTLKVAPEYKDILNGAMDYDINYRIVNYSYYCRSNIQDNAKKEKFKARMPVIDGKQFGCYDDKYDMDWNFRTIYEDLLKQGGLTGKGGEFKPIDMHLTQEQYDKLKAAGIIKEGSQPSKAQVAGELSSAVQKAKSIGNGNIPDYIQKIITELTEPQFDYYDLLYGIMDTAVKTDASWMNPRRKYLDTGYYLPDKGIGEKFCAGMFYDLSGSISEAEQQKFASEYFGLLNQLPDFELHVACFSDSVHENTYKVFRKDDYEAEDYHFAGTGGTDLSCITDWLRKKNIVLDNLIVLTDGGTYGWPDPDYCNNLIILCTTDVVAPVGKTYRIQLND